MPELEIKVDALNLENVKKAFAIANNAIYFNDRSDYLSALYNVCFELNPEMIEEQVGREYIEE